MKQSTGGMHDRLPHWLRTVDLLALLATVLVAGLVVTAVIAAGYGRWGLASTSLLFAILNYLVLMRRGRGPAPLRA